ALSRKRLTPPPRIPQSKQWPTCRARPARDIGMTAVPSTLAPPPKPEAPPRYKYRVRFAKAGDLRLVSHHDLMHVCERMFRRADLAIPVTQGFNPRPRMWFALSLALGVAGCNEVLEFELSEALAPEEVQARLAKQAPPGFD